MNIESETKIFRSTKHFDLIEIVVIGRDPMIQLCNIISYSFIKTEVVFSYSLLYRYR